MKKILGLVWCASIMGLVCPAGASDHADPMSLNPFVLQDAPLANITDLHAFVVDQTGTRRTTGQVVASDHLVISLCVRRRLLFWQINDPALEKGLPNLTFRVHLDFDTPVTHHDQDSYKDYLKSDEFKNLTLTGRNLYLNAQQVDARMEALYGGTIPEPNTIAEDATLSFRLQLKRDGDDVSIGQELSVAGIRGRVNPVSGESFNSKTLEPVAPKGLQVAPKWDQGTINVQAGIFDDPFIFPRFFRGNIIGVVVSVPVNRLVRRDGTPALGGTLLLWATTHTQDGTQSDHVGRSLRTQLPRFGHLNPLPPSEHVAAILRRHDQPTLMEDVLKTFIAPLEAHRFYDATPDVMIYQLSKPAQFPNGRWLEDDVAKTLSDAGETLLLELSYLESRQYPRADKNDKPFRGAFPFLALPWSEKEVGAHAFAGTDLPGYPNVPSPPDAGATALPDFSLRVWRSIWSGLLIGLVVAGAAAVAALRSNWIRAAVIAAVLLAVVGIMPIRAEALTILEPGFMQQPIQRLTRTLLGSGLIALLGLTAVYAAGIRRGARPSPLISDTSLLDQEKKGHDDSSYSGSTYQEVLAAVSENPYYGRAWSAPGLLPQRFIPIWKLALGIWNRSRGYPFREASIRTIESHADLRWGVERKGVERLLHPNGVCLGGVWEITKATPYTGLLATGSKALIIGRYSSDETSRSWSRTLSLVGKLFPTSESSKKVVTASFITQTSLGGARTDSIFDAFVRNAPDVRPLQSRIALIKLLLSLFAFRPADVKPTERQLYEIAEAGEDIGKKGWQLKCPRYMQLSIKKTADAAGVGADDFRDELLQFMYAPGDPTLLRPLIFKIEVSEVGQVKGLLNKTLKGAIWNEIGEIRFDHAVASYNGDFVIHFHHPKWRPELIDPTQT